MNPDDFTPVSNLSVCPGEFIKHQVNFKPDLPKPRMRTMLINCCWQLLLINSWQLLTNCCWQLMMNHCRQLLINCWHATTKFPHNFHTVDSHGGLLKSPLRSSALSYNHKTVSKLTVFQRTLQVHDCFCNFQAAFAILC